MNRKAPELPNIEDATLMACLAPLMDTMHMGHESEAAASIRPAPAKPPRLATGSNDNPPPFPDAAASREAFPGEDHETTTTGCTLAEWRAASDAEFAAFRMVESFLARTDAELLAAAAEFPRQLGGTLARLTTLKSRLAARYDAVTAVGELLRRALARAGAEAESGQSAIV